MPDMQIQKLDKVLTGPTVLDTLDKYIEEQTRYLHNKTQMMREVLLPKWVKIYKGQPEVERKTFPWPEAANTVVQVAATTADELLSRVMSIWQAEQLYVAQILGDFNKGVGEDEQEMLERFMGNCSSDPDELDMYRVEQCMFSSAIRYGTGIVKIPFKYVSEQVYVGGATDDGFQTITTANGPKPENVPLNKFLIDTQRPTLRTADFIVHITTYNKFQLQDLIDTADDEGQADRGSFWDKKALQEVLDAGYDRLGQDYYQDAQEEKKGMSNSDPAEVAGVWDFYECWFAYRHQGKRYRCIVHWHYKSKKRLGGLFNPYPDNQVPFEDAKLAYDDDQYYGYGFMEMLEAYQREISTTHNQRIDNRTLANTGAMRVAPNSKLASILQFYPGMMIPAEKDEIEALPLGNTSAPITTDDEELTLRLVAARSGVDPASGGTGGGIVNAKRGIYSAQGTAIAMQSVNNRNGLRTNDMRSAHVRLAIKIIKQYAYFGIDGNLKRRYGDDATILDKALQAYRDGKLGLLIKAATASNNRELDKQNDMLLMQTMSNAQQQDMQMLGALQTPNMPPEMKDFVIQSISAKNTLIRRIYRSFNHPDVDRLAPLPDFIKQYRESQNVQPTAGNAQGAGGPNAAPQPSSGGSGLQFGGGQANGGLPQLSAGSPQGGPVQ
jgi:hypothetical protein